MSAVLCSCRLLAGRCVWGATAVLGGDVLLACSWLPPDRLPCWSAATAQYCRAELRYLVHAAGCPLIGCPINQLPVCAPTY